MNSKRIAVIGAAVIFGMILLFNYKNTDKKTSIEDSSSEFIGQEVDLLSTPDFYTGSEDEGYNYLTNPYRLDDIECPVKGIYLIGNTLNDHHQKNGIFGQRLTITSAESDSIDFIITVSDEQSGTYTCTYNYMDEVWTIE